MARFTMYLSDKELEWVKRQKPGSVRDMVKAFMLRYPELLPEKEKSDGS